MTYDPASLERALILGKWPLDLGAPDASSVAGLVKQVVHGDFKAVLLTPQAKALFEHSQDADVLGEITVSSAEDGLDHELLRLLAGVACLHAFIQVNWTGPDLDVAPLQLLSCAATPALTADALNAAVISDLSLGGEPAYHLTQHAAFLWLAQKLFCTSFTHLTTSPWWRLRAHLVHQQLLDEAVAPPGGLLDACAALEPLFASDPEMHGRLVLEQGLLLHHIGSDKKAGAAFVRAARATGLQYELTGALGKRTRFQANELSQLVLLAESKLVDDSSVAAAPPSQGSREDSSKPSADELSSQIPKTLDLNDDTLLEHTAFTSSRPSSALQHIDPAHQRALHPLDQCILLALCLNVRNTSPAHGLTHEQMAPYVARVLAHPRTWSVHTMALLLRSRLEANRTRTVERAVLQIQALVDQMPTAADVPERLRCVHALALPSKWALETELARALLSIGVVKSALEIFERRGMWEEVARCYVSIERADRARAVVRDLLEGRKVESAALVARAKRAPAAAGAGGERKTRMDTKRLAGLWCLLGDLEPERAPAHYARAWELSGGTSGRAMRALGGRHFARAEYAAALDCLRRAVEINPLLARSWFVLGCAAMRLERWDEAKNAFGRCVAIDEEDGESWSNLASMYLRTGAAAAASETTAPEGAENGGQVVQTQETADGIPFANKLLAFRALKEGLKHSYDNWRMWANYSLVAIDVGELFEAARALGQLAKLVPNKQVAVDADVLDRLVDAAVQAQRADEESAEAEGGVGARRRRTGEALLRTVNALLEGTILPRTSSPRIQRAYARLLIAQGRWAAGTRAYVAEHRASEEARGEVGDAAGWRAAVAEVEELLDVLRNFGPRAEEEEQEGGFRWKLQARSIVRTFLGRHKRDFEDEPEYERLKDVSEELKG